jgi:hypothetical protein
MRKLGDSAAMRPALNHPLEELLQSGEPEILHDAVDTCAIKTRSLKIFFETM